LYLDEHLHEVPELTRARNAVWYEDTIVPLMLALQGAKPDKLILCVRNDGAIRDLPGDCSVEVPVEVNNEGVTARKVGSCPHFLKGLFYSVKQSDRLAVEAVRNCSYEYALQALAIHPLVPSLETARKYLDRIVKDEKLALH
jgi:6-phospho-beta-glucosidase